MDEENHGIYSFDAFAIDAVRRVLLRDDQQVALSSRAFDLLRALVESGGRELSKEELMQRIWANQIVEDANLTVTMANLRKALGEKAGDHRFIVTIPGRGYRFVAKLQREEPSIDRQAAPSEIVTGQQQPRAAADEKTLPVPSVETTRPGAPKKWCCSTSIQCSIRCAQISVLRTLRSASDCRTVLKSSCALAHATLLRKTNSRTISES